MCSEVCNFYHPNLQMDPCTQFFQETSMTYHADVLCHMRGKYFTLMYTCLRKLHWCENRQIASTLRDAPHTSLGHGLSSMFSIMTVSIFF